MWFIFALAATLFWGAADLFYKKGADDDDRQSHLKTAVWVGMVMGAAALILLPFSETRFTAASFFDGMIKYSPASAAYIISMVIGYAGLRYLEVSIISPVQNASGAFSAVLIVLWMIFSGHYADILSAFSALDIAGTIIIVLGVVLLAFAQKRLDHSINNDDKKFRFGAGALIFPLLYCLFDTLGTAADGIILDENSGMGLGEIDVLILYGATFFAAGLICWIYLLIRNRKAYNPFRDRVKGAAALCEEGGQIFYVYAMARNPVLAAPLISCYCIVSVLLGRLILKERLGVKRNLCIILVITGIVLLGLSEGISNI